MQNIALKFFLKYCITKSIYVVLILCTNLSNAINFEKCEDKDSALHCYFPNITTVNLNPLQSVTFCINLESSFESVTIYIYNKTDIINNGPETIKVFLPRQFISTEERTITILFSKTCNDKSMKNNTVTECFNDTAENLPDTPHNSTKLLVLAFEGHWKGRKIFTRIGKSNSFSNCDDSNKTSASSESFTKSNHGRDVPKNSSNEFKPYYIIIIIGIGIPFLGAMFALVWTLYHRKKENEKLETIEMEVMEEKLPKVDQPKAGEEEIDGPCYVNVAAIDGLPEEEVVEFEASNEISYIELDFEQTNNKNTKPKKRTRNYINGSKPKAANIEKKKPFTETPQSIYATVVPEPEATEYQREKDEIDLADDAVQYVNLD